MGLTAGLVVIGLTAAGPAARAAACPDPENMDCTTPPLEVFVHLTENTLTYYPASPVRSALIHRVVRARDALHPPNPTHPPNPARSYHLLGAYLQQVRGLAGTPNGASESGTDLLVGQAVGLRRQILAAYPAIHHPPNPAQPELQVRDALRLIKLKISKSGHCRHSLGEERQFYGRCRGG